jgi:hypothetical protein
VKNSLLHVLGVALLTAAALAVRLVGIDFGLPMRVEIDCKIPYQVEALRADVDDAVTERHFTFYPLLLARAMLLWPAAEAAPLDAPLEQHLAAAARPFVRARISVALLAALLIPSTWLLARRFATPGAAYFAAALTAVSVLHVSFSQQARPHAPATALFLATVLAAVHARRRDGWTSHLLVGVTGALALGCLQSGVFVLPAIAAAYVLRAGGPRRLLDGRVLIPLVLAGLAVPLFYPFLMAGDVARDDEVFQLSGHLIFLDQFNGAGFPELARALWSYEPALLGLAALAAATALARRGPSAGDPERRRDAWVLLAFALPYLAVFGLYERTYERFLLPLLPYLALVAACGLWRLPSRARAAVAVAALALPTCATVQLVRSRAAPDTQARAAAWMAGHLSPADDVLVTTKIDLPLVRVPDRRTFGGEPALGRAFFFAPWTRYQAELAREVGELDVPQWNLRWMASGLEHYAPIVADAVHTQGGDYAVVEVYADRAHPLGTHVTEAFRAQGELLARFSPDADPHYSEHPLGYQDETTVRNPHFTLRILQARCSGPVIEIYRLDGTAGR